MSECVLRDGEPSNEKEKTRCIFIWISLTTMVAVAASIISNNGCHLIRWLILPLFWCVIANQSAFLMHKIFSRVFFLAPIITLMTFLSTHSMPAHFDGWLGWLVPRVNLMLESKNLQIVLRARAPIIKIDRQAQTKKKRLYSELHTQNNAEHRFPLRLFI